VALTVVAVPSVDETIQLFVDGRSGQVTDVLIDCAGACTGVLLTWLASRVRRRRA
jgi:VanZ family protein